MDSLDAPQFALKNFFRGGSWISRLHFYHARRRKFGFPRFTPKYYHFSHPVAKNMEELFHSQKFHFALVSREMRVSLSPSLSFSPLAGSDFKHIPNQDPTGSQTCEPQTPHHLLLLLLLTFLPSCKKATHGFHFVSSRRCNRKGALLLRVMVVMVGGRGSGGSGVVGGSGWRVKEKRNKNQ